MADLTKKQFIEHMETGVAKLRNGGFFFLDIPSGYMFGNQKYGEISMALGNGVNMTASLFKGTEEEQKNTQVPEGEFEKELVYGKHLENLIEITAVYERLRESGKLESEINSISWKQKFVELANEFEDDHGKTDWSNYPINYLEAIEQFAERAIMKYAETEA